MYLPSTNHRQRLESDWSYRDAGCTSARQPDDRITAATTLDSQITNIGVQWSNARNQRDVLYNTLWDTVKRVRAGTKTNFMATTPRIGSQLIL